MASRKVPQEVKNFEFERINQLRQKFGRVPNGQGQFTHEGVSYKVKTNNATPSGLQIKQVAVDRAADATRRGVRLSVDDYINHPRYKGAPKLARQMYKFDKAMLKSMTRHASPAFHLDHINPINGDSTSIEHYRNRLHLGASDNGAKSNRVPSQKALDYLGIGKTKQEMIDRAASSPWPKQTPRNRRTLLQGDLGTPFEKGMGKPKNGKNGTTNGYTNGISTDTTSGYTNGKSNGPTSQLPTPPRKKLSIRPSGTGFRGVTPYLSYLPEIDEITGGHIDNLLQSGVNNLRTSLGFKPNDPNNKPKDFIQQGQDWLIDQLGINK